MTPSFQLRAAQQVVGILLAAGRGKRFDPTGVENKLLQRLPDGRTVAAASAQKLLEAGLPALAVVRPGTDALAAQLVSLGCEVTVCPDADDGMAASLVHVLAHAPAAAGWIVALGDMPFVQASTLRALADAVGQGADIAVPTYRGSRGNPVAFGRAHLPALLRLAGDQGARQLVRSFPVHEIPVEDPGILLDVDSRQDLARLSV